MIQVTFSLNNKSEVAQICVCQREAGTAAATAADSESEPLLPSSHSPSYTSRLTPDSTAHSALYM